MRNLMIKHNPYRIETEIVIDGESPKQNSRLNFENRRLQEWIEELPEILFDECRSRDFKLSFHGTILDYEDVESMANEAKKDGFNFELEHIPAKEASDKENVINEIFDAIQEGPFDELKQKDVVDAFKKASSSEFEVSVVATMSAGKSTLINALLGRKIMPAKNAACTATITEIKDNDDDCFKAKVFNHAGDLIQTCPELTAEIMKSLNANSKEVSRIKIEGNIPFVSSDDIALVLVDTPGPNNAGDPAHKAATLQMLSESSKTVILYILNATQLETEDDSRLLSSVAESMKVGGKQSRDRFIFVVNKLDDFNQDDDNIEEAIGKVRNYLRDKGIENANIYPASAITALDIRTILTENSADKMACYQANGRVMFFNEYPKMHFEKLAPLTGSARRKIEKQLMEAKDDKEKALIHCGIVPIEMAIQTYVQKYAKTAKIKNIVDTFSKRLESAKSFEITKQEITENQDKQKEILANIEAIKKKLASGEDAKRFKDSIEQINYDNEIKKLANNVIMEAQKKITAQLSSTDTKISKREAEELCKQFARFADNLQAEVQVKLEQLITNHVHKSARELLDEYRKKISELAQDISVGSVSIDPFELMTGEISGDASSLINNLTEKESVKVDEVWVGNTNKKWYKPWTWFQESGHWEDVYEDKEYVDGTKLSQRFFAPIQERLFENNDSAIEYAKEQTKSIKREFSKKFTELDAVLKHKLQELEDCANDNKDVERRIRESQAKLKWLEDIQAKTKAILDI